MTQNQPAARKERPTSGTRPRSANPSTSPAGTRRAGRREVQRRRYDEPTFLERFRTPLLALAVGIVVIGVSAFVLVSAAQPAYACGSIDTVQPAASGELGQVQPDMGNRHVQPGDKITYTVCPPASGRHINQAGLGPIQPKFYGPDDERVPNGWVHNLEHGGLVLLYSCDKGACTDPGLQQLRDLAAGFPNSPVCKLAPGLIGPVITRFEQMPTKYAVLVWDRVMYLDTLDPAVVYDFFNRYAERVSSDGSWLAPPEPQCAVPSPSAGASPAASAGASPAAGASASPAASPATPAASPSAAPSPAAS